MVAGSLEKKRQLMSVRILAIKRIQSGFVVAGGWYPYNFNLELKISLEKLDF